jgi:hypothetical protein
LTPKQFPMSARCWSFLLKLEAVYKKNFEEIRFLIPIPIAVVWLGVHHFFLEKLYMCDECMGEWLGGKRMGDGLLS